MELSLDCDFRYTDDPEISVLVQSPLTGFETTTYAFIDTGAQRSLLDMRILRDIGHSDIPMERLSLYGVGGGQVAVELFRIRISLLGEPALTAELPLAFSEDVESGSGNLIGLDVLQHFDFGLAHRDRLGYLGRR